jgi:hypothetical protein
MDPVVDLGVLPLLGKLSDHALAELVCQADSIAVSAPVAALLTGMSRERFRQCAHDGLIPGVSLRGHVRVPLAALGQWSGQREFDVADFRRVIKTVSNRRRPHTQESNGSAAA